MSGGAQYSAVVTNGVTSVGRQDLTPLGPYAWVDLSGNIDYPGESACSVGISSRGNDLLVQVLTSDGEVWQTLCTTPGALLLCVAPWVQQTTPPSLLVSPEEVNDPTRIGEPLRRAGFGAAAIRAEKATSHRVSRA
ncbi:hypothetical protein [Streptomyces sp. WMMC905]|uniref:hypothetical protein n=1 Tax=Streptomyces sp. WMMC905 TaxID=3404123 RepID=UPI003B965CFB